MFARTGAARPWEPKRLRLRLFSAAGRPRRTPVPPSPGSPMALAATITAAFHRLQTLAPG
jgi:hypothetical protein